MNINTITIDFDDLGSIAQAITDGITTPELLEKYLPNSELVGKVLVIEPEKWHSNDGNYEVEGDFNNGKEAAEDYVNTGDWQPVNETCWIDVRSWREGVNEYGDIVQVNEEIHTITLEPKEPDCNKEEHNWQSPYEILGGLKENPGAWGNGGGVIINEVCMNCGCKKITNTWAQNPNNGQQGLLSVEYKPEYYTEEITNLTNIAEE